MRSGRLGEHVFTAIAYGLFGVLAGVITTFIHRARIISESGTWWFGIVLALVTVFVLTLGLRLYLDSRTPVIWFAIGIVVAVFALSTPGFGRSVVIPGEALGPVGTIWAYGSALAAALPLLWPKLPPKPAAATAAAPAAAPSASTVPGAAPEYGGLESPSSKESQP